MKIRVYRFIFFISLILLGHSCRDTFRPLTYSSSSLEIKCISSNVFMHTSYLKLSNNSLIPCNGMIYCNGREAIIVDTPTTDSVALELINFVKNEIGYNIKAIIVSHFHVDCLGGLNAFHQNGIPSYASNRTIALAQIDSLVVPQNSFEEKIIINVGKGNVVSTFYGAGHTKDNVVVYLPSEEVLFGGCLIKEMGANKGNLNDADLEAWPKTVSKIKDAYPNLRYIIPGHGAVGGTELLDYTIKMFSSIEN